MAKDYEHGFGTGEGDQIFDTEGQARKGWFSWFKKQGTFSPPVRKLDGRVVEFKGKNQRGDTVVIDVRKDLSDPHPETAGSIDVRVKVNGNGISKHFGFRRR